MLCASIRGFRSGSGGARGGNRCGFNSPVWALLLSELGCGCNWEHGFELVFLSVQKAHVLL